MAHGLVTSSEFEKDQFKLPRNVFKQISVAFRKIERDPFRAKGKSKKIYKQKYGNIYGYTLAKDYRIIYCVGENLVRLLAVGNRSNIHKRFHADPDDLIIPEGDIPIVEVINPVHFDKPVIREPLEGEDTYRPPETDTELETKEPLYDEDFLNRLGIPKKFRPQILKCTDEEELIDLDVPDEILELVLGLARPASIEQIIEQPVHELPSMDDLEKYYEGTLKGFLLKLDPEQERVARKNLEGPTMVKGGPGTGKSLVALYRVRNLLQPDAQASLFEKRAPKILFVTFTTTLIEASRQLLKPLIDSYVEHVTIDNLDKIVKQVFLSQELNFNPASKYGRPNTLGKASDLLSKRVEEPFFYLNLFNRLGWDYILTEFDWVIEGRNISSLESYLKEDRKGCGTGLNPRERKALWELHEIYTDELKKTGKASFGRLRIEALQQVTDEKTEWNGKFDVVIVDEAQDLTPVALRFCLALCKEPKGLYMTADAGQSIYQRGFSWRRVDDAIQIRGRTTILKYNYRSTKQISDAALQILTDSDGGDPDTRSPIPIREGPKPSLLRCASREDQIMRAAKFIDDSIKDLNLHLGVAAVFARTNKTAETVVEGLSKMGVPAEIAKGDSLDLDSRKVKVMTIHSAKGLEFPIVVMPRVDRDQLPLMLDAVDPEEKEARLSAERRLFSMGMSRAMRRLAVTFDLHWPSPFIDEIDKTLWNVVS